MPNPSAGLLRPLYFDRQQLRAADLMAGQNYLQERLRRHNRFLHGWGVVCGAQVTAQLPWQVSVGEGYVITPHGDELYLPGAIPPFNIEAAVTTCLETPPPCPDPEDTEPRDIKILGANLNPAGKDRPGNYNQEWLEIQVTRAMSLSGYTVQHTINIDTSQEAFNNYYRFPEGGSFPAGTVIRIHSGAEADHVDPKPGRIHRYVAQRGQVGNWRLNNLKDRIRVLDAAGRVVAERLLEPALVYLVVSPAEEDACPQPVVPANCQPTGGEYRFSRRRETYQLGIRCELPETHQAASLSCAELEAIVCGQAHAPCPPAPETIENFVVLATISVADNGILAVDDLNQRRFVLSQTIQQAYLCCFERGQEPPPTVFTQPTQFTIPTQPTILTLLTQPTILTQPTLFTRPTLFTLPTRFTLPIDFVNPELDFDPGELDLERGLDQPVTRITGIGPARTERLNQVGITNIAQFALASPQRLAQLLGVSEVQVADFQFQAQNLMRRS